MTLRLNEEKISAKTSVLVYTQVENGNEYTAIAAVYDADKGEKKRFADILQLTEILFVVWAPISQGHTTCPSQKCDIIQIRRHRYGHNKKIRTRKK